MEEFYIFKITYHLFEFVYTLIYHRARPDFPEYVLHHLMTFSLIFFSYSLTMTPMGSAVMFLHDVTDLTATIFKLTIDITPMLVQALGYLLLLVSWVYFRLWFFPMHVIQRLHEECYQEDSTSCPNVNHSLLNMLYAFVVGLTFLHVFWFYLMIKGLLRRFSSKEGFFNAVSLKSSVNQD
jgi:ceramide synthetase